MKRALILGVIFLAACGGGNTNNINPSVTNPANAVADTKIPNPTFTLAIVLSDGHRANSSGVNILSIRATSQIKARKVVGIFETRCTAADVNNAISGCQLVANNAYPNTITKTTFNLYSGAHGRGCLLATAVLKKYTTYLYEQMPVTFKLLNVQKCWK